MNRFERMQTVLVMFVMLLAAAVLAGCPKKTEVTSAPEPQSQQAPAAVQAPEKPAPAPDQGQPAQDAKVKPEANENREKSALEARGLQPVYFDFDQSAIRTDARDTLKGNAEWLKAHPQARIRIEGNCDERGTREYNQALGQRRAANAKKYLADLGIPATRISLISYGKEKPSCTEATETCWQRNRRDDFIVVTN